MWKPDRLRHGVGVLASKRSYAATSSSVPSWATVDPNSNDSMECLNRLDGKWIRSKAAPIKIPDPINAKIEALQLVQNTQKDEVEPFIQSLRKCSKSGLHNPLKNPQR